MSDVEPIIDSHLPIVDSHHHLWFMNSAALEDLKARDSIGARALLPVSSDRSRYLFDELMLDVKGGHNVRATVYVDAHSMYRASGPEEMRSLGEVEFANGMAAMAAIGTFGDVKACAAIVGNVELRLGDAVEEILRSHLQAGGGRYRGVRCAGKTAYDADESILGRGVGVEHLLLDDKFRVGFRWLH